MAYIRVNDGDPIEKSLRRFKRLVEREGILKEFKQRRFYEKRSETRKKMNKLARNRMIRKMKKIDAYLNA